MKITKPIATLIITLITTSLHADFIDIEKELYEPVAEMQKMDETMNQTIEQRHQENQMLTEQGVKNQIDEPMPTFSLEGEQYVLTKNMDNPENTKVEVNLKGEMLNISTITTTTKEVVTESGTQNSSFESTTEESLSIPHDADASTFQQSYENGELRVTLEKKKELF